LERDGKREGERREREKEEREDNVANPFIEEKKER